MTTREQIIQQALALPPEDRIVVADALEHSLAAGDFSNPEIAAAWAVEIERRITAYDRGDERASGFAEALGRMRRRLAEHQQRKATS